MNRTRTLHTPRRQRLSLAAIGIVGVLATALFGSPAFAQDATPAPPEPTQTPTSPVPEAPSEPTPSSPDSPEQPAPVPTEAASLPRATQTIARSAVPTTATGFKLQYAFGAGVQPVARHVETDVTSEADYDWSDSGTHYLQWDYPMPADGHHAVTFTAELIDHGASTGYTVRYTSAIARVSGSISVRTDCEILKGGVAVDLQNDSPFTCEGASAQSASGAVLAGGTVSLLNWSTITGIIDVRNDGTGPAISLGEGTFSTANQQRRIIMNGTAWYPLDASVQEQRKLAYATIPNGGQLTWMAAQQNFGVSQTEPDTHAQATFNYRIYLDGKPTPYWIDGWAENYKYHQGSEPSASCSIYFGDPNTTGKKVVERTPFTCEPTAMSKPNIHTYDDTTFQVRMAVIDTLTNQADAKLRGITAACGDGGDGCIQTIGKPALHVADAAEASVIGVQPNTQGKPEAMEWKFDKTWTRKVTDSVEHTFGLKYTYEVEVELVPGVTEKEGIEISSETSYGYDLTKGLEYSFVEYPSIPFGAVGSYVQFDAWNVYQGDIYFYGEGGSWYRVTGTTVMVPIDMTTYGAENVLNGHLDAKPGAGIGNVQFRCVWDDANEANVLLHNPTLEELTACQIPDTWSDDVPHVPGVKLDPDLIRDARAVLANDLGALNARLQEDAEKLVEKGGE
ncbi:hypothetical protein [Microbacterium timonense]|uniref:hypothetical protein n=1 Tax=Microbacterium timonense TaxID=2086576 RepID=UPI000D0FB351|nr:hypothetical protein [Microbacterium timonense]